jgi:hypothetical protein
MFTWSTWCYLKYLMFTWSILSVFLWGMPLSADSMLKNTCTSAYTWILSHVILCYHMVTILYNMITTHPHLITRCPWCLSDVITCYSMLPHGTLYFCIVTEGNHIQSMLLYMKPNTLDIAVKLW